MPRMKQTLRIVTAALTLITSCAMAQVPETMLKDYTGVTNLLRANGIEPSAVRWNEVEAMCMPLKAGTDTITYNRCRYERARDQIYFINDANICNVEARAFNPKVLRYRTVIDTTPNQGPDYDTSQATLNLLNTAPAVADAGAFRSYMYNHCMTDRGWRSPNNYRQGQFSN